MNQWVRWMVVLCWLGMAGSVAAAERVALVIGNGQYNRLPDLPNPKNDAAVISEQLKNLGFELVGDRAHIDITKAQLSKLLLDFQDSLKPDSLALFYFAGHGAADAGINYLLTVDDADLEWREQLKDLAFDAKGVLDALQQRSSGVNIIVLDACRDNPLPSRNKERSGDKYRGLATMASAVSVSNMQFFFSAKPGEKALDGKGQNSPFTMAFVQAMRTPGLSWEQLMKMTTKIVREIEPDASQPYWEGSMVDEVFLNPGQAGSTMPQVVYVTTPTPTPAAPPPPGPGGLIDLGNGRLQDTRTQLIWTQSDNGVNHNWEEAKSWCEGQGMRLPSLDQLETIYLRTAGERVACGDFRCSISPMFKLSSYRLWSSNRSGRNAQSFYFNDGAKLADPVDNDTDGRVLCVTQ